MGSSEPRRRRRLLAHFVRLAAGVGVCSLLVYGTPWGESLNVWANRWVAASNAAMLARIGVDATVDGTYIHTGTFSVVIVDPCNGLRAMVLAIPACLALPCGWGARAFGATACIFVIIVFNQVRLIVEMLFGSLYPEHYAALEEIWMRLFFVLVFALALWGWTRLAIRDSLEPQT